MFDFALPSLGADMDEGTLLRWLVQPGDTVHKGQVVAVVDTSKAAIDVEIWQDGQVLELLVQAGEKIPVGTVLARLLEPGEAVPQTPAPSGATPGTPRSSPAARKRAQELGVDWTQLQGSGADGAVTLADVEQAAAVAPQPAPHAAPPQTSASEAAQRQQAIRRAIAAAMGRSKREIPHYYLQETVPLATALQWLEHTNAQRPITERLLLAVLQIKAVARALQKYPEFNGLYQHGQFQPAPAVHVGVAISLRHGGLLAPALLDVASKPLDTLMHELTDLVQRARSGSLRSSEMAEPTITITNLGEQGVEAVFGVIYPPQVALVGFGRVMQRPWVQDGQLCAMPSVIATLSADHRVSDGHRGALFLAEIRDWLQRPQDL